MSHRSGHPPALRHFPSPAALTRSGRRASATADRPLPTSAFTEHENFGVITASASHRRRLSGGQDEGDEDVARQPCGYGAGPCRPRRRSSRARPRDACRRRAAAVFPMSASPSTGAPPATDGRRRTARSCARTSCSAGRIPPAPPVPIREPSPCWDRSAAAPSPPASASAIRPPPPTASAATPIPHRCAAPASSLSDGVGCEACHGGAEKWIASHTAVAATHAGDRRQRHDPAGPPAARASVCLDCHFGSDRRPVRHPPHHGGGHPRIAFELDLFSTLQQHWNEDADYATRKGQVSNVKV